MVNGTSIEQRLEEMTKRLARAERGNRAMKIWGAIAILALVGFGSGPFASTVMAKKLKIPARIVAQEFVLISSTGAPLAALVPYEGGAELAFLNGATTRTAVGFNTNAGGGLATFDASGTLRTYVGTDQTGVGPNGLAIFDANGEPRIGVAQSAAEGNAFYLQDADGKTLRGAFTATDSGSAVDLAIFDATGAVRTGVEYDPSTTFFNGFYSQDGSGHNLSLLGNVLAGTTSALSANDSFMSLLDTSGTTRVTEFQNSTNEGGVNFNPGSTTPEGGWGNP